HQYCPGARNSDGCGSRMTDACAESPPVKLAPGETVASALAPVVPFMLSTNCPVLYIAASCAVVCGDCTSPTQSGTTMVRVNAVAPGAAGIGSISRRGSRY